MPFSCSISEQSSWSDTTMIIPKPRTGPIQQLSVVQCPLPEKKQQRTRNTANRSNKHTHFRISKRHNSRQPPIVRHRENSPSNGLRLPSCSDRLKTQQNLIHNQQRTNRP